MLKSLGHFSPSFSEEMDSQRLKGIVRYICGRSREQPLRVAQIHHILWRADGETYVRLGRAIVAEEYVRQFDGPRSLHLDAALDELKREAYLEIRTAQSNIEVVHVLAQGAPDIAFLSESERRILDEAIERVVGTSQDFSQGRPWEVRDSGDGYGPVADHSATWKTANIGERIGFQQQLLETLPPLTKGDAEWVASELKGRR